MTRVTLRPGPQLANTSKVIDARGARPLSRLVVPDAAAGDAQQPCQRVEVLWPRCRGLDLITSSTSGQLDRDTADRLRTVFGTAQRPRRTRRRSLMIEAAIETPTYDLTVFKLHFGRLTGKAYTKGERVLRFDAIAHNTAELRCGKMIDKFAEIVTRLAGIAERFATALDCVDTGFIRDAILDGLPTGVRLGATRIGVSTSTNPGCATRCAPPGRWRRRPTGSPPPSSPPTGTPAPGTITSATASARRPTACANCGANGSTNPAEPAATTSHPWRTIAALLTLRDQLIAPILAAVRSPAWDTNPRTGHASTATTNESASICKRSSTISPSKPG